jgi:phage terminase large subunit-like protein
MPQLNLSSVERAAMIEEIMVLEEIERRRLTNLLAQFDPYPWQLDWYSSGKHYKQRMLMAANRVGKTFSAAREFAYHATGIYPEWWDGLRFKQATRMWALGVTSEQIRDVIQKELLGDVLDGDMFGCGAIPLDKIDIESVVRSPQTRGLVKDVKVKHASGGYSSISFKAYSQGQHVLMGASVDFIWIDEEPEDQEIYPQCVTRTATGNAGQGGTVVLTFTPENGMTPIVCQFLEDLAGGQYLQNVTWDDAPHLSEDVKEQILSAIPEYQRKMRSQGIPVLGSGVIFPVADETITCEPFQCPDHWLVLNGCDFGWDHPQAHVQLWIDPDTHIVYVAHGWRAKERDSDQAWTAVKTWSNKVPVSWPHDGHQHEKGGGLQLRTQYKASGFNMMESHATHVEGGISVESGLWSMLQDMRDGQFKVFNTLPEFFEEKRLYHRNDKGKIVKERDDLICAARYAYMMQRNAVAMGSIKKMRVATGQGPAPVQHDFDPYAMTDQDD